MPDQQAAKRIVFQVKRSAGGQYCVAEYNGGVQIEFSDLSGAMRYASENAASRGAKADIRFDSSLAMILAAG